MRKMTRANNLKIKGDLTQISPNLMRTNNSLKMKLMKKKMMAQINKINQNNKERKKAPQNNLKPLAIVLACDKNSKATINKSIKIKNHCYYNQDNTMQNHQMFLKIKSLISKYKR